MEVSEAPTSDLALTLRAIQSAQKTLRINSYELTSTDIAAAIQNRIQAGVQVDILAEGEPVPKFPQAGVAIRNAFVSAIGRMNKGSYHEMEGRSAGVRRFVYDHAKYMVVDESSVLIGSENYSPTGQPQAGAIGNRGWEVFVHDATLASEMMTVFNGDDATANRDIHSYTNTRGGGFFITAPDGESYTGEARIWAQRIIAQTVLPAMAVTPVFAPDTSLNTLVSLIRAAKRTLDIEQMNFDSNWDKQTNKSPLLAEVVAAARRGVQVRVLLNDDAAFGSTDPQTSKNSATVSVLNQYATTYRLGLSAKIANLKGMGVDYIHNKGVLVDGNYTLVSSINWGQNSIQNNRESGIILTSPQVNAHYQALFNSDWAK